MISSTVRRSSGGGTTGMVNWCCRGLSCCMWKEAWQMSMGCPCWMAFTERTLKLRPSLVRSTWYRTGTLGSPEDGWWKSNKAARFSQNQPSDAASYLLVQSSSEENVQKDCRWQIWLQPLAPDPQSDPQTNADCEAPSGEFLWWKKQICGLAVKIWLISTFESFTPISLVYRAPFFLKQIYHVMAK